MPHPTAISLPGRRRHLLTLTLSVLATLLVLPAAAAEIDDTLARELPTQRWQVQSAWPEAAKRIKRFYARRDHRPLWLTGSGLTRRGAELVAALDAAPSHGLDLDDYHASQINRLLATLRERLASGGDLAEPASELELTLTDAYLTFALHLGRGRLPPAMLDAADQAHIEPPPVDLGQVLTAAANRSPGAALAELVPTSREYVALRQAHEHYRQLALQEAPATVPAEPVLRPGDSHPAVRRLRARLRYWGDLSAAADTDTSTYDVALQQAVEQFQTRHGLVADGIIGGGTRAALNRDAAGYAQRIAVNLERWRWLPRQFGERYIQVNVPDFRMQLIDQGKVILTQRVVVGREFRPTPLYTGSMTYMVANPYWNVPHVIAAEDMLPKIQRNLDYLRSRNIVAFRKRPDGSLVPVPIEQVPWQSLSADNFPYVLKQAPGPDNALGQMKFMFSNPYDVYLHATPANQLFDYDKRAFSSGCIRLEAPRDLADYLLKDQPRWAEGGFQQLLDSRENRTVLLRDPLPVYLVYWTAWVDEESRVHFRPDVYARDEVMLTALERVRDDRRRSHRLAAAMTTPDPTAQASAR